MISDLELITKVKTENDSDALNELIHRHSGIYCNIAQKFSSYSDKIQFEEIKDDKAYNIYQFVLSYDPDKKMKFGTYVGEMTKYMCKGLLTNTPEKILISDDIVDLKDSQTDKIKKISLESKEEYIPKVVDKDNILLTIREKAKDIKDPRFLTIFQLRYFSSKKVKSWRKIGQEMGITHECARKIYNKHITSIQKYIKHEQKFCTKSSN